MTSSDGVELNCTIDTDMPWKMVAKGSRSSTRRNKKLVAASDAEAEDKISSGTLAGESESEKLGFSVPGQHFAERVEHIPIKKRRFMVPSPSIKPSAQRDGSEDRAQINNAMPVSRLNPNLIDGRTSDVLDENHDFSGIEILANVACSTDMNNDIAPAAIESLLVEESVVQQQDASTLSAHVEGNYSSAGTDNVSQKYCVVDSSDQGGQGKSEIIAPKKSPTKTLCRELSEGQSVEHCRLTCGGMIAAKKPSIALSDESSTERPKTDMAASESKNLAPDSAAVTVSGQSSAHELTEKNNEALKDDRFHWDLNVPMDAWDQHCAVEDEACRRDIEGEMTESIVPNESEPIDDGSKDRVDEVIASDGLGNFSSPSGPKVEAAIGNGKECQSGYDSQFEDGELREPYPWEENEGEMGEVEQVDYGSEPEDERLYSMVESNDNKMEDSEKGILAATKLGSVKSDSVDAPAIREASEGSGIDKHIVVCMNDSHLKKRSSSPSRSFVSKPFKELPSHDAIHRRRYDNYEELSTGPDKFVGRDERSGMRMRNRSPGRGYFSGWDYKCRFSPPNYKSGSYGFGRPQPKSMVADGGMMSGFNQSGSGPGPGPGPDGHIHRQFSNGGYKGRFRRFREGGDRDFRGRHSDTNQFPGRMHDRMSGNRRERGNSPVLRRLNYPQSESRSRSRSPVSWNGQNRSSPPPLGGFRADERMMERVRLPYHKRFPADQEMGFMSPPRNKMSSPRFLEGRKNDNGENHNNSFRESKFRRGQRFDSGYSMRRPNSDNNNQFRQFIRHRRFDGAEENTGGGGNRYEMPQQRAPRRSKTLEDVGDDTRRFRFNGEEPGVVANNNNNNKESC